MSRYTDEQKRRIIEGQRQAMHYGTVTYDTGQLSGPSHMTGWVGWMDVSGTIVAPGKMVGQGVIMCIVMANVDETQDDQHVKHIPLARVLDVAYPPQVP